MNNCTYIDLLTTKLQALKKQDNMLTSAADAVANAQQENRLIHIFGSEPMLCGQLNTVFFMPGSLTNINLILDPVLDPAHGAYRGAMCLPLDGLAPCILDYYEYISADDPMIILGSDPELPMFTQALEWAQKKGLKTIAIIASGNCPADYVIRTECANAEPGVHSLAAGAALGEMLQKAAVKIAGLKNSCWSGEHFVDLEKDRDVIDEKLYRIRHL